MCSDSEARTNRTWESEGTRRDQDSLSPDGDMPTVYVWGYSGASSCALSHTERALHGLQKNLWWKRTSGRVCQSLAFVVGSGFLDGAYMS